MVKIFVGCLDVDAEGDNYITSEDLQELFEEFGELTQVDRIQGKPFGFVHMQDADAAKRACQKLNRHSIKGQRISVECSRSKPVKYYVGRLPKGLEEYQLKELFEKHGASVLECDIMKNKNYAFVHIETNSDKKIAEQIIHALDGYNFDGSNISVQFSETVKKGEEDMMPYGGGGRGRGRGGPFFRERPSPYPAPMMGGQGMMGRGGGGGGMHHMMDRQIMNNPMMNSSHMNPMMGNPNGMGLMNPSMMNPMMMNPMMGGGSGIGDDGRERGGNYTKNQSNGNNSTSSSSRGTDFTSSLQEYETVISHDNLTEMGSQLTQLVKTGRFIDTQIQCSDATFKAHGVILAAKSPVFSESLSNGSSTLYIREYSGLVVNVLLQFIYSGKISLVDVGPDCYQTILQAAEQYSINGAKDAVVIELAKGLNPANVIQTLQFSVDGGLPELKTFATKYIAENRRVIMADTTTKLQLKQFPDVMLEIVESMG